MLNLPGGLNLLLEIAPHDESVAVRGQLSETTLDRGTQIYRADEKLEWVYFPTTCVLSAVTLMQDGTGVEIGTIGREGVGGVHAALGVRRVPSDMLCQVAGQSFRMPVDAFARCVDVLPGFRSVVHRYAQSLTNLMGQSIACNRLHNLTERCCRWLLMTRDRAGRDEFYLTQEFLAYMLGVRRSGVTLAAGTLQKAGFIEYSRGHVKLLDIEGLKESSCECYRIIADEFDRLLSKEEPDVGRNGAAPAPSGKLPRTSTGSDFESTAARP